MQFYLQVIFFWGGGGVLTTNVLNVFRKYTFQFT